MIKIEIANLQTQILELFILCHNRPLFLDIRKGVSRYISLMESNSHLPDNFYDLLDEHNQHELDIV